MRTARGFTLIELMIGLAILAIVLGLAVPSFLNFIRDNRVSSQVNEFATSLTYARSEAVKRGLPVAVVATNGVTIAQGWCVHLGNACDNNPVNQLRTFPPLVDVGVNVAVPLIQFGRFGEKPIPNGDLVLTLTPNGCATGAFRARIIRVAPAGRVAVERALCP